MVALWSINDRLGGKDGINMDLPDRSWMLMFFDETDQAPDPITQLAGLLALRDKQA